MCSGMVHPELVANAFAKGADGVNLPPYPIPVILIARLAVTRRSQGMGVGSDLMLAASGLALDIAGRLGVYAVTVFAMSANAKAFYQKRFGFTELLDNLHHLFVTIADLRASGIAAWGCWAI